MAAEVIAGRFELIEHIARGGSGPVWLARDLQCSMRCAAKVMPQSYGGQILHFVRGQGVKFDHPHLLTPYGWAAADEDVVIASQLMRGGNLHTAMQDYGAFSPELVAEILTQLLDGLDHVHAAGWVHRDVKPANVLLELTGTQVPRARLADFGIAVHKDAPRPSVAGRTVGTDGYLAPQQRAGQGPDAAQDLYALGVLGMQLLDPALRGQALHEHGQVPGADSLLPPPPLGRVLSGLLNADPQVREQAASDAEQVLRPLRNPRGYQVASGEVFEVFDHFAEDGDSLPDAEVDVEAGTAGPGVHPPCADTLPVAAPQPIAPAEHHVAARPAAQPAGAPRRAMSWWPVAMLVFALLLGALSLWLILANTAQAGAVSTDPGAFSRPPNAAPAPTPAVHEGASSAPARPADATSMSARPTSGDTGLDVGIQSSVRAGRDGTVQERGLIVGGADHAWAEVN